MQLIYLRRCSSLFTLIALVLLITPFARADVLITPVDGSPKRGAYELTDGGLDFDRLGYEISEFFIEGEADSYHSVEPLTNDAEWVIAADGAPQPFKTRIQVVLPKKPQRFNGTVYVEWFNVTARRDAAPEWAFAHVEMQRQGAIYVGISAQAFGILDLVTNYPDRYGSLSHPGDSYSYDIFRQVSQALSDHAYTFFGPDFTPQRFIAAGESQSAARMTTYVNGFSKDDVFSGYMIHSRGSNAAALRQAPLDPAVVPAPTLVTSLDEPVFTFQSETDSLLPRQDDSSTFRWWEVAGTAHADAYLVKIASIDHGDLDAAEAFFDLMINVTTGPTSIGDCKLGFNAGPHVYVFQAALRHLNQWVAYGTLPPIAPRMETDDGTGAGDLLVGEHGNVLGGIRSPHLDVPIAIMRGTGNENISPPPPPLPPTFNACFLFGVTTPFSEEKLDELYPRHGVFVRRWIRATLEAQRAGFFTPEDAVLTAIAGAKSDIGKKHRK